MNDAWVNAAIKDMEKIYSLPGHEAGGCLHLFYDDLNLSDDTLEFCWDRAHEADCDECMEAIGWLDQLTLLERAKVVGMENPGICTGCGNIDDLLAGEDRCFICTYW